MNDSLTKKAKIMVEESDITRIHARIDRLGGKFDDCNHKVLESLSSVISDLKVLTKLFTEREKACKSHTIHTDELDTTLRGNGKKGVLARLAAIEQKDDSKEKFAYLIIGALGSGVIALIVKLIGS